MVRVALGSATLCVLFQALWCLDLHSATTNDNFGIYGGDEISIEEAPFMVALYIPRNDNKTYFCGGSIIHHRFILTAAHCLRDSVVPLSVWGFVGSDNVKDANKVYIKPEKKLCHEEYNTINDNNDICLLKLKYPLQVGSRKIAQVTLPYKNYDLKTGTEVNVTGWGFTEHKNGTQTALRRVAVPIDTKICRGKQNTIICTRAEARYSTCKGDSGGPVTYGRVQIGVISGGLTRKCGNIGSRHTRVATYVEWIKSTVANNLH